MGKGMVVQKYLGGKYSFDLLAADGLCLGRSVAYDTEEDCQAAVERFRKICMAPVEDRTSENAEQLDCPKYEIYNDDAGGFKFRLRDENGDVVFNGPDFVVRHTCRKGLDKVLVYAPDAGFIVSTHVGKPGEFVTGQALNV